MEKNKIREKIELERKLKDYEGEDRIVDVKEVYEEEKKNQKPIAFGTGIQTIDGLIDGFKFGQLICITGLPKRGKTTFARTITKNIENEVKILWFSFEESVYEFYKEIEPADFYIPRKMKYKDMDWVEERIIESKLKYKTEVVFIDHLHYLFALTGGQQNTALLVGDLMRNLKRIAIEQKLVIFILAHTRKVEGNRMPRAEDVRDSALIANECDKMFVVHRDRTDSESLGVSTMSEETKVAIELDRQNGKNMGIVVPLNFEDNILKAQLIYEAVKQEPSKKHNADTRMADNLRESGFF